MSEVKFKKKFALAGYWRVVRRWSFAGFRSGLLSQYGKGGQYTVLLMIGRMVNVDANIVV